jgi:phenylacetate-CoA ligase
LIRQLWELRRLLAARRWSSSGLQEMQAARLRTTIRHAALNVPYYRDLFRRAGLDADSIRTPEDLRRVPVTTKADLVAAGADAFARDVDPAACTFKTTSGSTGRPLRVPETRPETRAHDLLVFRTLFDMGLGPRDRMAVVSAIGRHQPRLYQRLGLFRSCNISRLQSPGEQLLALQRYQPTFVWAYSTVLRDLLPLVDDQLNRVVRPRAIVSAGEVMDPHLRARLRGSVDADLFNLYGSTETGIIAGECPAHRGLHVHADRLVLECVGANAPVPAGERGAAVVTCLGPRALRLIRYRLGDVFRFVDEPCPCGSAHPLMEAPVGRDDDALALPDGRRLYPGDCDAFVGWREVLQYRFIEERAGVFRVRIKLRGEPTADVRARLERRVAEYLGAGVSAQVELIDRFPAAEIKFRIFLPRPQPR